MLNTARQCLLVLILLLCSLSSLAVTRIHPNTLIVFGDGNVDNGLTYATYHFPISPPYWHGRFSNGPVYVEYLAHSFGLIMDPKIRPNYNRHRLFYDYAYYNAVILKQDQILSRNLHNYMSPLLRTEINQFLAAKPSIYPHTALVLLDIGSNDIAARQCLVKPWHCLRDIIAVLTRRVLQLCAHGYRNFVIVLPADLQSEPGYQHIKQMNHNQKLYADILPNYQAEFSQVRTRVEMRYPSARILLFNKMQADKKIQAEYRIPSSNPCYNNGMPPYYLSKVAPVCHDPAEHMYFDNYFYATAAQRQLAHYVQVAMRNHGNLQRLWHPDHIFF